MKIEHTLQFIMNRIYDHQNCGAVVPRFGNPEFLVKKGVTEFDIDFFRVHVQ